VQRALKFAIDGVTSVDEVMRSMSGSRSPSGAEPDRRRAAQRRHHGTAADGAAKAAG